MNTHFINTHMYSESSSMQRLVSSNMLSNANWLIFSYTVSRVADRLYLCANLY